MLLFVNFDSEHAFIRQFPDQNIVFSPQTTSSPKTFMHETAV